MDEFREVRWVQSDEVRRKWRHLIDEVMTRGAHIGVLRHGKKVGVIVPDDWHERALAALGEVKR